MDKEKSSLFQRIRNARQSLENAEKSFQDDKGMRGELDLMLAEAELKNLRNKQNFPWSWNRHSFALTMAVLLFIAGIGGWFYGKENLKKVEALPQVSSEDNKSPVISEKSKDNVNVSNASDGQKNIKSTMDIAKENAPSVRLSEKDMRKLVRTAKNELSSGK